MTLFIHQKHNIRRFDNCSIAYTYLHIRTCKFRICNVKLKKKQQENTSKPQEMVVFSSLKIDIPKKKMCCKAAKTKKVKEQKQTKNKQKNPEAT